MHKSSVPWGLSPEDAELRPWDLKPHLLYSGKRITDVVHGTIYLNELEVYLLKSPAIQRLRRVRQLGTTHLVYPSATHVRFAHALGALHMAQQLMNALFAHMHEPGRVQWTLLDEWAAHAASSPDHEIAVRRWRAEAIVLARLGGLLHDMTHVPYGHTIEDDLGLLTPHDKNGRRFKRLWEQLDPEEHLTTDLIDELLPLVVSKTKEGRAALLRSRYPFVHDVVGNTICADLLDYLWRDHMHTGLPFDLGDRFLSSLFITRSEEAGEQLYARRVAVALRVKGLLRPDVKSELLKCLRFRYELDERVLTHKAKLAADAMIGKLFALFLEELREDEMQRVKHERQSLGESAFIAKFQASWPEEDKNMSADEVEQASVAFLARDALDDLLVSYGDDGILEYLAAREQRDAIWELANDLLNRNLYALLGQTASDRRSKELYVRFGSPEKRAAVERDAALQHGLHPRQIALWIPTPRMRLKPADVLVSDDSGTIVAKLGRHTVDDAQVIYAAHRALWRVAVYVDRKVDKPTRKRLKDYLSRQLGNVQWEKQEEHRREPSTANAPAPVIDLAARAAAFTGEVNETEARGVLDQAADADPEPLDHVDPDVQRESDDDADD